MPCKKIMFPSAAEAKEYIQWARHGNKRGFGRYHRVYECARCGGWHFTSQKPKEKKVAH